MFNRTLSVQQELTTDLKERVVRHRERFSRIFHGRYKEMLPSLIVYENNDTSINFLKVEYALRSGYDVAIGTNKDGHIVVLGWLTSKESSENPTNMLQHEPLTKDDINFVIPKEQIPDTMKEISYNDNCSTGDFVVLRNKTVQYVNDMEILTHYTMELAEIVLSRYSMTMQAKINTFFVGDPNDETINQLVSDLYNGSPYTKVSKLFDPQDQIVTIQNEHMASNFQELKREYQNVVSELNSGLGINSLAVEKSSGVSDVEAKGNKAFVTSNANIYLEPRNKPLGKLNKRFSRDIYAVYNDEVASELMELDIESDIKNE